MNDTKKDTYVELVVWDCYSDSLDRLKDLIARAESSGLDAFTVDVTMGYYDSVESITIRAIKADPPR